MAVVSSFVGQRRRGSCEGSGGLGVRGDAGRGWAKQGEGGRGWAAQRRESGSVGAEGQGGLSRENGREGFAMAVVSTVGQMGLTTPGSSLTAFRMAAAPRSLLSSCTLSPHLHPLIPHPLTTLSFPHPAPSHHTRTL